MILEQISKEDKLAYEIRDNLLKYQQIFGGINMVNASYLSSGNEMLDELLGGGYKKGTLTELCGVDDSGKTLLALKAVKEVEKENKISLYVSPNCSLNSSMLEDNDIDKSNVSVLYMNEADTLGPILTQIVKPCIDNIGLIVIDSLADLTTVKEKNSSFETNTDISRSKIIKSLLTRLTNLVRNTETCVIIINQERTNVVDNEIVGTVSTSERWVNMCCDTRIKLTIDEDGDSCVNVRFKERKL